MGKENALARKHDSTTRYAHAQGHTMRRRGNFRKGGRSHCEVLDRKTTAFSTAKMQNWYDRLQYNRILSRVVTPVEETRSEVQDMNDLRHVHISHSSRRIPSSLNKKEDWETVTECLNDNAISPPVVHIDQMTGGYLTTYQVQPTGIHILRKNGRKSIHPHGPPRKHNTPPDDPVKVAKRRSNIYHIPDKCREEGGQGSIRLPLYDEKSGLSFLRPTKIFATLHSQPPETVRHPPLPAKITSMSRSRRGGRRDKGRLACTVENNIPHQSCPEQ